MEYDPKGSSLKLGSKAPYFSLPATNGRIYSIADFAEAGVLVVVFMGNHCPYARAYEQRLAKLAVHFREQNVAVIAICSNDGVLFPEDSFEQMIAKSEELNFAYLYLQDQTHSVARAYGAQRTPEAYLFDSDKVLRYHGAIDDNYADAERVECHYLADAVQAVLLGTQPEPSTTKITGCSIKFRS